MSDGPLILIPKPMPRGPKTAPGQKTQFPVCDRCRRESSDRNPVLLSERKSWQCRDAEVGRRDAICAECREILKGRLYA